MTENGSDEACVGILCAKGWAVGYIGHGNTNKMFADRISAIACVTIEYDDGSKDIINTDPTWEVYTSYILDSEIYHGETADLTAEGVLVGNASVCDNLSSVALVGQVGEYVKERERVAAKELIITPKGERVIDFGQNLAGYAEIHVKGKRGDRIVVTHAEVLDKDGNFYTDNLRSAKNRMEYTS